MSLHLLQATHKNQFLKLITWKSSCLGTHARSIFLSASKVRVFFIPSNLPSKTSPLPSFQERLQQNLKTSLVLRSEACYCVTLLVSMSAKESFLDLEIQIFRELCRDRGSKGGGKWIGKGLTVQEKTESQRQRERERKENKKEVLRR